MRRLDLAYPTAAAFVADHGAVLAKGRAFIAGASAIPDREECELALVVPGVTTPFVVRGEAVWSGPNGVGFALQLDATTKRDLAAFAASMAEIVVTDATDAASVEVPPDVESSSAVESSDDEPASDSPRAKNLHERIRALNNQQREDVARRGSLPERIALERAFGASVWEGLLQNPQLSVAEVARIAKNGTIPKPLVSFIVGNSAWLASAEVQRALLSNPRCSGGQLDRVLMSMRRIDLQRLTQACPYRSEVRAAATKMVKAKG